MAQFAGVLNLNVLRQATAVVTQPLWFIGIYLIVTALAPPMRVLHKRFGVSVPIALAAGAVLVDIARFAGDLAMAGFLNFGFVWLFAHQLGFFYADGALQKRGAPAQLIGVVFGLASMALLTRFGPYPLSMVGLPGETVSNMNPPTICLIALTIWQVSALMIARDGVTGWLRRPRIWGAVIAANAVIMTMFLWHLTALMIVVVTLLPAGFPQPAIGTAQWWALRPVWLAILCAVTALFVLLLGRFERPGQAARSDASGTGPAAAVAVTFVILGVCGFAVSGLVDFVRPNGRQLIAVPVSPIINIAALGVGGLLFWWSRRHVAQAVPEGSPRISG